MVVYRAGDAPATDRGPRCEALASPYLGLGRGRGPGSNWAKVVPGEQRRRRYTPAIQPRRRERQINVPNGVNFQMSPAGWSLDPAGVRRRLPAL